MLICYNVAYIVFGFCCLNVFTYHGKQCCVCTCVYLFSFAPAAKNLILAGVKSVMLHDEGNVELWDLSSNFVFSEDDVGKNRALVAVQKLQELNNAVVVHTLTTKLAKEQLADFQVHFSVVIYWLFSVMQVYTFGACLGVYLNHNCWTKFYLIT